MSKSKGVTIYEKEKGKGWYGDFRRLGGKLEALIPKGERRATIDRDTAEILKGERIAALKSNPKLTRGQADKVEREGSQVSSLLQPLWRPNANCTSLPPQP